MIQKKKFSEAISANISVVEGLIKNYPYVIRYQNTSGKNTFYIKIIGLTYGIILFSTTKNYDAPYVITARSGTPATDIYIGRVNGSFNGIKPCRKIKDSSLYFECEGGGISGRYFDIYIYNKFKEVISYSIEDNVDGLIYVD